MELTFEDFKERAVNPNLSKWEKIGFPDSYRKESEELIFQDIYLKLGLSSPSNLNILDIGCGCSNLVSHMINFSNQNNSYLYLVDSEEMLSNINTSNLSEKIFLIPGFFPKCNFFNQNFECYFDRILIYSVLQYVFLEQSIFQFIHKCIDLLRPSGRILIGDIPNLSSRERFLMSSEGEEFKKNKADFKSDVNFSHENKERIDDSIIISILSRFRNFGCETFLLPQPRNLPFGNRREDILIIKR